MSHTQLIISPRLKRNRYVRNVNIVSVLIFAKILKGLPPLHDKQETNPVGCVFRRRGRGDWGISGGVIPYSPRYPTPRIPYPRRPYPQIPYPWITYLKTRGIIWDQTLPNPQKEHGTRDTLSPVNRLTDTGL